MTTHQTPLNADDPTTDVQVVGLETDRSPLTNLRLGLQALDDGVPSDWLHEPAPIERAAPTHVAFTLQAALGIPVDEEPERAVVADFGIRRRPVWVKLAAAAAIVALGAGGAGLVMSRQRATTEQVQSLDKVRIAAKGFGQIPELSGTITVTPASGAELHGTIFVDHTDKRSQVTVDLSSVFGVTSDKGALIARTVANRTFVTSPLFPRVDPTIADTWIEFGGTTTDLAALSGVAFADPRVVIDMMTSEELVDARLLGTETVDGVTVKHYEGTVGIEGSATSASQRLLGWSGPSTVQVWVDLAGNVKQLRYLPTFGVNHTSVTVSFAATTVEVPEPPVGMAALNNPSILQLIAQRPT